MDNQKQKGVSVLRTIKDNLARMMLVAGITMAGLAGCDKANQIDVSAKGGSAGVAQAELDALERAEMDRLIVKYVDEHGNAADFKKDCEKLIEVVSIASGFTVAEKEEIVAKLMPEILRALQVSEKGSTFVASETLVENDKLKSDFIVTASKPTVKESN